MDINFLTFNGYGLFVWPAFIFAFLCCLIVYLKTARKLKKYEYLYTKNYQNVVTLNIKTTGTKKKKALSASLASIN